MAEQTQFPAPMPSRSIYGFVIFILFGLIMILYVFWSFTPMSYFESVGITELPNKYFALFLPILVLTALTFFAFLIYPSISFIMTPNLNSIHTITDKNSIKRCQFHDANKILCDNKIQRSFDSWDTPAECENHQNRESRISNYCDCKEKEKCELARNDGFLSKVRNNEMQNSAGDLDIFYVSQVLYGKSIKK